MDQCRTYSPDISASCNECVTNGLPEWACAKFCASSAASVDIMDSCITCIATTNTSQAGCQQCVIMGAGNFQRTLGCHQCIEGQGYFYPCTQCLKLPNDDDVAACFDCLALNINNWNCIAAVPQNTPPPPSPSPYWW